MGLLEVLLIVAVLAINFIPQVNRIISKMPEYPFYLLTILFLAHLFFESYRWQLTIFYFILVIYIALFAYLIRAKIRRKTFRVNLKSINRIVVAVTLVTVILIVSFPVINLPDTTGLYNVGTVTYPIVNPKRVDGYSEGGKAVRNFNIQVFYPSDDKNNVRMPWLDNPGVMWGLSKYMGIPKFMTSHLAAVTSNSYGDTLISKDKEWPVVIVSHGWTGFKNVHQDIIEDLASWGYVVVAVDHTYGSLGTVLADGSIQLYNEDALPKREETPDYLDYGEALIDTYMEDIYDTIRALESLNKDEFLSLLDLESIALIGHSTGGGAALKVAMLDDRISSLIAYDPWVEPIDLKFLSRGLDIPMLILSSSDWIDGYNAQNLERVLTRSTGSMRYYEAIGFDHVDFTWLSTLSPWTGVFGVSGDVSSQRTTEIMRRYNLTFLNSVYRNGAEINEYFDSEFEEMKLISSVYSINH